MDEQLQVQRQLIKQLKFLNFWIASFGFLLLAALAVIGFLLFQVIVFARDTGQRVQQFQDGATQSLNLREQACKEQGSLGDLLRQQSDICKQQ